MPILLVFTQYKNVDVVGPGVAKQSSSISWALLSCKYKTDLTSERKTPFFDAWYQLEAM